MKTTRRLPFHALAAAAATLAVTALPADSASAQTTAVTEPVGFVKVGAYDPNTGNYLGLLGNSDTLVSLPFTRPAEFTGSIGSISGNVITISTSPNWTANQFVYNASAQHNHYYAIIGPKLTALTGTLAVTNNGATVTGTGTAFTTQLKVGDGIFINTHRFNVSAITSDTSLTLNRVYNDVAATGVSASFAPKFTALTGTLAVANNSATVTGTGTTFTTQLVTGDGIFINGQRFTVSLVASNTSLTLTSNYTSTSAGGLSATTDRSSRKEGAFYDITANDTSTVTVNLNGDYTFGAVAAGSQVSIIPHWTLATVFPPANTGVSFTPTSSPLQGLKTQVLLPDYADPGTNLSFAQTYYFINSGSNIGWRSFDDTQTTDHGDDVLIPDGYFAVRNENGSPTLPLVITGSVLTKNLVVPLSTGPDGQDNSVAITRPVAVSLDNSGLSPINGFKATTSTLSVQDQLFVYDNADVSFNKSPVATYYYVQIGSNVGWRSFDDSPTTPHGGDLIPAGSALTLQKAPTTQNQTTWWVNSPTY